MAKKWTPKLLQTNEEIDDFDQMDINDRMVEAQAYLDEEKALKISDKDQEYDEFDLLDSIEDLTDEPDKRSDTDTDNIPQPRIYQRKAGKHYYDMIRSDQRLHEIVNTIPNIGDTWHIISASRFHFWGFTPNVIRYLGGYTEELCVATWTTNMINTKEMIKLFDEGHIGKIVFVAGTNFHLMRKEVSDYVISKIVERGQKIVISTNHAKVILLNHGENYITIESSANLSANPRNEQYTYTNHKGLWEFYRKWFEDVNYHG